MKKQLFLFLAVLLTTVSSAQNLTLLGHITYNGTCAGAWHYVDSLNTEYAIVGVSDKISIVDLSNPAAPTEVYSVPALTGQNSLWRELKTYGKFAYAVSEGGGGVIVIDLSNLPGPITYTHWYGDGAIAGQLNSGHTIAADNGYIYIFGSNIGAGGCIIADLVDPSAPHFVGEYSDNYVHDAYVRNDTMWAGEIYAGQFSVIDVTNKANPQLITTVSTPGQFCHNVWLNDAGTYAFTTDEVNNAPVGSYNVSNIGNIQLEETYLTDSLPSEEVHNVRVLNDYIICPSYGSELTIVDGSRPDNLVEIARAPTSWNGSGSHLCWDASPYLPSGIIIATDIDGDFFVFQPDYQRASFLEGVVTDSITGNAINGATVEILTTPKTTTSNLSGIYKTGIAETGTYDVKYSKQGYVSKTITGVSLASGVVTNLNVELASFTVNGSVNIWGTATGIANAQVVAVNGAVSVNATTDANGNFTFSNVISGTYTVVASQWGYESQCITATFNGTPINMQLVEGYSDDFSTDNNWMVNSTCTTGAWVRGAPIGTLFGGVYANPNGDVTTDCTNKCFVTGNAGGTANTDDIDDGGTSLTSPIFDLTGYSTPNISYSRWYFISPTTPAASIDTFFVTLNNGITSVIVDMFTLSNTTNGAWVPMSINVASHITPTATMTLSVYASDKLLSGNIAEAGFDDFRVTNILSVAATTKAGTLQIFPNPFNNSFMMNLDAGLLTDASAVHITDVTGREIYSAALKSAENKITLPVAVSPGVYFVKATGTVSDIPASVIVKN
ncbi:MAG: choice-of-anchor B family protein [Bacteroidota bacterium]